MNSMTGYGFKEAIVENTQISVEIKSVNSRFLDLSVNIPSFLNPLEARIRKTVSEKIVRGKIDLTIRFLADRIIGRNIGDLYHSRLNL